MILSVVCGIISSRFVTERRFSLLLAVIIGTIIGLLGALGVFGVVYPFYVARVMDILWIPEVTLYAVFFIIPQIKIYFFAGAWLSSEMPLNLIALMIFAATSIASVVIGQWVGQKWFSQNKRVK